MLFKETKLKGAYIIKLDKKTDPRGFFVRNFCRKEFKTHGLKFSIKQSNLSFSREKGTLRGIHYQVAPYQEIKLVSCIQGAVYDVIIDLRKNSKTYLKWFTIELNAKNLASLYIPKGFAHGFQTLTDNVILLYQMSEYYRPESSQGIRWDDAVFKINWPLPIAKISQRDNAYDFWQLKIA